MKRDVPATPFKIVGSHEEQSTSSESPDKALVPLNSSAAAGSASSSTLQRFGQRSRTEQGGASLMHHLMPRNGFSTILSRIFYNNIILFTIPLTQRVWKSLLVLLFMHE